MVLVLAAALAACSGDNGEGAPVATGTTSTASTVLSSTTSSNTPGSTTMTPTTAAPGTTAAPTTTAPTTTAPASTTTTSAPATTTTTATCPGPSFGRDARSNSTAAGAPELLRTVRVAHHDCYDRVVFELTTAMPEWRVAPAAPPFAGPSGIPVDVRGTSWLHVRFGATDAHTVEGEATVGPTPVPVRDATVIRQVQLVEDFEAVVVFVIGIDAERPFRVLTIADPPRLVIDVYSN